jgi:hypothetical protein
MRCPPDCQPFFADEFNGPVIQADSGIAQSVGKSISYRQFTGTLQALYWTLCRKA